MKLFDAFSKLDENDFRVRGRSKHLASEMAVMTLCSVMSGGTSYYDIVRHAKERETWLRSFLELKNGIPSHDAFRYFWTHLPASVFNACFVEWMNSFLDLDDGDGVHIDGKVIRRAASKDGKQPCIVSAYSSRERVVIGQVKTVEKSNEITAIPTLLQRLALMGCIVTIDAAGCQRKIVRQITDGKGDYIISLKGNQERMHEEIKELFDTRFKDRDTRFKSFTATEKGHGRIVTRTCTQTDCLEWFQDRGKWAGLRSVIRIETETIVQKTGETKKECRHFISSMGVDPERLLRLAVSHWEIENPLHWVLDMVYDEDYSRARAGFSAENLAIMRHFAYDVTRLASGGKEGITATKKGFMWNEQKLKDAIFAA